MQPYRKAAKPLRSRSCRERATNPLAARRFLESQAQMRPEMHFRVSGYPKKDRDEPVESAQYAERANHRKSMSGNEGHKCILKDQ